MRPIKIQIEYGKHSAIWKKKILNQTQIEILSYENPNPKPMKTTLFHFQLRFRKRNTFPQ